MHDLRRTVKELRVKECGISSVEHAMLLAMVAGGIIAAADLLSGAVSNEMTEAASWFGSDSDCGNNGSGNGTGGDGGAGQGGSNTC